MSKDVVVVVSLDSVPVAADVVDILLITTERTKEAKTYTSLADIATDWTEESTTYKKARALFEQGKATPTPSSLIRKVTLVGFEDPATPSELIADMKEFQQTNDSWYVFLTDQTEDAYIEALADFAYRSEPTEADLVAGAEDRRKFYFGQTDNKSLSINTARAAVIYTENLAEHADAAWVGSVLPWYPKAVTWKFKMPDGVSTPELTDSEVTALEENHVNFVTSEYKKNYIKNGCCSDGNWIDVVIGGDWIAKTMREKLYEVFMSNPVIQYTDGGFTLIGSAVMETLDEATGHGIIAANTESGMGEYEVVIPKRSQATDEQAKNRVMPDISWEAVLGGAIHGVKINGTLKVSLS